MTYKVFLFAFILCLIYSCDQKNNNAQLFGRDHESIDVKIIKSMGQAASDSIQYLPLIVNLGVERSVHEQKLFMILGKSLTEGKSIQVKSIGKIYYQVGVQKKQAVLGIPLDPKFQTIVVNDFDDFALNYGSVKWMIETYYNNYRGIGNAKFLRWGSI